MSHQVAAEVVGTGRVGAYHHLTFFAPEAADEVQPGHFVALAVGGPDTSMLLRRAFSVFRAHDGSIEIVLAVHGRGTAWLAERRPGDVVDLVGPLGRPFALPARPVTAALVGGGYGSAPLFALAEALRERGGTPHLVVGAASAGRLFAPPDAAGPAASLTTTTEDGSAGVRGRVTDVLPEVLTRTGVEVVFTCGPMAMLAAVAAQAAAHGVPSQCAVEEAMACGVGVCMTCVLPVAGADGRTRMLRACTEGPVFAGDAVRWDTVGTMAGAAPAVR